MLFIFFVSVTAGTAQIIPSGTNVYFAVHGKFNSQPAWDVNLINAPINAYENRPAELKVSKKLLGKLNDKRFGAFRAAAEELGIKASTSTRDLAKWREHASDTPPYTFECDIQIAGDNGVGGLNGGLDIRMTLRSVHPDHDLTYGFALGVFPDSVKPSYATEILQNMYHDLFVQCYADWEQALAKNLLKPNCKLRLEFDMTGLDESQMRFLQYRFLKCLYERGPGNRYVGNTESENIFQITYQLKRFDSTETEAQYISAYAQTIEQSIGTFGKYECTLAGTPLENRRPIVLADLESKTIRISWTP